VFFSLFKKAFRIHLQIIDVYFLTNTTTTQRTRLKSTMAPVMPRLDEASSPPQDVQMRLSTNTGLVLRKNQPSQIMEIKLITFFVII